MDTKIALFDIRLISPYNKLTKLSDYWLKDGFFKHLKHSKFTKVIIVNVVGVSGTKGSRFQKIIREDVDSICSELNLKYEIIDKKIKGHVGTAITNMILSDLYNQYCNEDGIKIKWFARVEHKSKCNYN